MSSHYGVRFRPTALATAFALIVLAGGGYVAAPASAASTPEPRRLSQELPLGDAHWVTLDFPVGELRLEATEERVVRVELQIACDSEPAECDKLANKMKIDSRRRGEKLAVEIRGPRGTSSKGVKLKGVISAPRDFPLSVDMGVGDLEVRGFRHDLYVDLGVGNVLVRVPEASVRSVSLKSGVGDTSLALPSGRIDGTGFVGKGLRWTSGKGSSLVEIECGVGNVETTLD